MVIVNSPGKIKVYFLEQGIVWFWFDCDGNNSGS